jgi:glycosyltransferase involved in cell wall biosynthesis
MKLSVLIPVFNRVEALGHCLTALAGQTLAREDFEVIVCDDGSADAPEIVAARFERALDLRVLRLPHRNRAAALNAGVRDARGDLVLFTDADMVPTPTLLERHVAFHRRDARPEAALLGHMDWDPTQPITRFMRYIVEDTSWQFGYGVLRDGSQVTWGYFYGGNSSVKRAFLLAHGLHDEELGRAEDIELGYRLCRAGMALMYDAQAVNHHRHFVTLADFARRNRAVGQALVLVARRHPELCEYLPVFASPFLAREAERHGLATAALVERGESVDGVELEPDHRQSLHQVWEFALWAALGDGVRDGLRADAVATPVRCSVIIPTGGFDPPIPPALQAALQALEPRGFEFLPFQVKRHGALLSPSASLDREVLRACNAAAAQARGRQLCFVHRLDLDVERVLTLTAAAETTGGLVVEGIGPARDAVALPRPLFFEACGLQDAQPNAVFGWRLGSKLEKLGYGVRRIEADRPPRMAATYEESAKA